MSEATSQDQRTLAISQIAGYDFLLLSMYGTESLGRMFQFELELISVNESIDPKKVLGQNTTVALLLDSGDPRYFNGYISRISLVSIDQTRDGEKLYMYRATLVPAMWFLTRCAACRVFQSLSVTDIIQKVYKDRLGQDATLNLQGTYQSRDYCVQYRETEFNFISRLMEEEGIYYYFTHENGKHTLVLCDAGTAHEKVTDYEEIKFSKPNVEAVGADLWNWNLGYEVTPSKCTLRDHSFLQPTANMEKDATVDHSHDPQPYEVYDFPGGYAYADESRNYADARLNELTAAYAVAHATTAARGLMAGCKFSLTDHPTDDAEYLITSITYRVTNDDLGLTLSTSGEEGTYQCQLTCIPSTQEFRTPRTTPKPVIQGPQTAVVVGPSGEEIHTDKYARVKVQFFWDREGKKDENSSCWLRVSQTWAGKTWGAIAIPRIGQEVIVEFLEGDPDRPIVTGRVYNAENMPPYALPANKTMTTFKSNSSMGGGGFNELRFEDKKDSEQIFIWAQKNMDVNIQNDRFETIKHDHHMTVTNNVYLSLKNEVHMKISSHFYEDIAGDHHEKIAGQEAREIDGAKSLKVGGNVIEEFQGNHSSVVSSQLYLCGDNVIIEGKSSVTINVGGSSIAIAADGIQIKTDGTIKLISTGETSIAATADFKASGMNTTVEAQMQSDTKGMMVNVTGQVQTTVKGAMTTVSGDAMTQVSGGIIMIG